MRLGLGLVMGVLAASCGSLFAQTPPATAPSVTFLPQRVERSTTVHWADSAHAANELLLTMRSNPDAAPEFSVDRDGFTLTSISDETGRNLMPSEVFNDTTTAEPAEGRVQLRVRVPIPENATPGTISLSGTLRCVVIGEKTTIEVADLGTGTVTRDVAGYPVTIALHNDDSGLTLSLSGRRPADADATAYERFLKRLNGTWFEAAQLTDGNGKRLQSSGGGATLYKDRIDMHRRFETAVSGAISLSWTVPTSVSTVDVPVAVEHVVVP